MFVPMSQFIKAPDWVFVFFFFLIFIYLASAAGLSCGI